MLEVKNIMWIYTAESVGKSFYAENIINAINLTADSDILLW